MKIVRYIGNGIYLLACALSIFILLASFAALWTPSLDNAPPLFAGTVALTVWSIGWLARRALMWIAGL